MLHDTESLIAHRKFLDLLQTGEQKIRRMDVFKKKRYLAPDLLQKTTPGFNL
jgi:hypothetical protein